MAIVRRIITYEAPDGDPWLDETLTRSLEEGAQTFVQIPQCTLSVQTVEDTRPGPAPAIGCRRASTKAGFVREGRDLPRGVWYCPRCLGIAPDDFDQQPISWQFAHFRGHRPTCPYSKKTID